MQIRVYYEDTDAGGIVYHSNYINFCERARSEILFSSDMSPLSEKRGFIVKHIDASFIKPSKLGDILHVRTHILDLKKVSMKLRQSIYNSDNNMVFDMKIELVYVDGPKMARIPDDMINLFNTATIID